ncbi:MAG: hypothetical protein O2U61_05015 [Candidatus Bathyarchaeota archaeon]|nr:hypothetical protein [Candidatus Bathyarchaeota archaeon]
MREYKETKIYPTDIKPNTLGSMVFFEKIENFGDLENKYCSPFSNNMKKCEESIWYENDNKLIKLNDTGSKNAYIFLNSERQLSSKEKKFLQNLGVKNLEIFSIKNFYHRYLYTDEVKNESKIWIYVFLFFGFLLIFIFLILFIH